MAPQRTCNWTDEQSRGSLQTANPIDRVENIHNLNSSEAKEAVKMDEFPWRSMKMSRDHIVAHHHVHGLVDDVDEPSLNIRAGHAPTNSGIGKNLDPELRRKCGECQPTQRSLEAMNAARDAIPRDTVKKQADGLTNSRDNPKPTYKVKKGKDGQVIKTRIVANRTNTTAQTGKISLRREDDLVHPQATNGQKFKTAQVQTSSTPHPAHGGDCRREVQGFDRDVKTATRRFSQAPESMGFEDRACLRTGDNLQAAVRSQKTLENIEGGIRRHTNCPNSLPRDMSDLRESKLKECGSVETKSSQRKAADPQTKSSQRETGGSAKTSQCKSSKVDGASTGGAPRKQLYAETYHEESGKTNPWGSTVQGAAAHAVTQTVKGVADHFVDNVGRKDKSKSASAWHAESHSERGKASADVFHANCGTWTSKLGTGAHAETHVAGVRAENKHGTASAAVLGARASAKATVLGVAANAEAFVAEASAQGNGIPGTGGLFAPNAKASVASANAVAEAGVFGVKANAVAQVARAGAGIAHTPLQAHAATYGAEASAGCSFEHFGASAGAYVAEAEAGPFGIRAGLKFGVEVKYGVPKIDVGPVSCSIS